MPTNPSPTNFIPKEKLLKALERGLDRGIYGPHEREFIIVHSTDITAKSTEKLNGYLSKFKQIDLSGLTLYVTTKTASEVQRDVDKIFRGKYDDGQIFIIKILSNVDIQGHFSRQVAQQIHGPDESA